jgi:hypothetical protein
MTLYTLFRLAVCEDRNDIAEGALDTGFGVGPDINDVAAFRSDGAFKSRPLTRHEKPVDVRKKPARKARCPCLD